MVMQIYPTQLFPLASSDEKTQLEEYNRMRCISIQQPCAQLIVLGLKDIENRNWTTLHRGPLLIHASKRIDKSFSWEHARSILNWSQEQCEDLLREMKTGGIIGKVNLVDSVKESTSPWFQNKYKYGFVLQDAHPLPFMSIPGAPSIFEINAEKLESANNLNTPSQAITHVRTNSRPNGVRLTKAERELAQKTFLKAYEVNGSIMLSCKKAGISRNTFYQWLEHDEQFSLQYNQAEKDFGDIILAEFTKRATKGYERTVVSMGHIVYNETPVLDKHGNAVLDDKGKPVYKRGEPLMERVVSDNLLAMAIKKHFPEYRDKQQIEHSGPNGGPINIKRDPKLQLLTDEELAQAQRIALQLSQRQQGGNTK
jgi:ASCH domain.